MGQIVEIFQAKTFSLMEAEALLPVVRRITREAVEQYLILEEKLKHHQSLSEKWKEIEDEIAAVLNHWSEKMLKLGCRPKGIWLVDFDNGKGYYCWRYGDERIQYFHGYHDGFAGRTALHQ